MSAGIAVTLLRIHRIISFENVTKLFSNKIIPTSRLENISLNSSDISFMYSNSLHIFDTSMV